jgi:hypothetical protein
VVPSTSGASVFILPPSANACPANNSTAWLADDLNKDKIAVVMPALLSIVVGGDVHLPVPMDEN